ncbi:MAG: YhcH/YjgK/YiaL family protein [Pseudomonadota bacterium]
MILDVLDNAKCYLILGKGFPEAIGFLQRPDLAELPVGTYKIDGDRVYAMVAKDSGRKKGDALLETHEKYIDIQLVLSGTDEMGWKPKSWCKKPTDEYDAAADIHFFADAPDAFLPVSSGLFAIFFPDDAHMPLISSGAIHKVVVKVAVDQK